MSQKSGYPDSVSFNRIGKCGYLHKKRPVSGNYEPGRIKPFGFAVGRLLYQEALQCTDFSPEKKMPLFRLWNG